MIARGTIDPVQIPYGFHTSVKRPKTAMTDFLQIAITKEAQISRGNSMIPLCARLGEVLTLSTRLSIYTRTHVCPCGIFARSLEDVDVSEMRAVANLLDCGGCPCWMCEA